MLGRGRLAAVILSTPVVAVTQWWLNRDGKALFVVMMLWSLVVVPIMVPFASRNQGGRWALVFFALAVASVVIAVAVGGYWCGDRYWTAVPGLTAAALFITAPWLAPWALHDLAGRPAEARVVEAEPVLDIEDEDTWKTNYRLADAATERDLGRMHYGPRTRARVGAVITVSVVPNGWSPPIATERLDDTDVEPGITACAALALAHALACAVTAAAWPREID